MIEGSLELKKSFLMVYVCIICRMSGIGPPLSARPTSAESCLKFDFWLVMVNRKRRGGRKTIWGLGAALIRHYWLSKRYSAIKGRYIPRLSHYPTATQTLPLPCHIYHRHNDIKSNRPK